MKKLIFIISLFITSISYGQIVGPTGNVVYNRGIGVNDGTKDSIMAQQSDRRWTMIHRYDMYGANARGNFIYGNLAGSSQTGTTEAMIAIGHNALRLNTIGYNVGIGWQSLYNLDAGSSGNLALGAYRPMYNQTGGNNNILLGYNIDQAVLSGSNQLNIGSAIWGVGINDVTGGSVSTGKIGLFKTTPTEALDLVGNFRFSGAIMPNNTAGTSGQVLTSAGAGAVPTWTTPGTGGETNTASNLGGGIANYSTKVGVDLRFNTFNSSQFSLASNVITLDSIQTSGAYTATATGVANVASVSDANFTWRRIGDWYDIQGELTIDPTTTLTLTRVRISLPLTTSITDTWELIGTASDDLGTSVRIRGDVANDEAELRFTPSDVTARVFSVHFRFKYVAP